MSSIIATIVAATGAVAACATAYAALRKSRQNNTALQEIHVLVNSRLTAVLERVDQLTKTLEHAGIVVPIDPSTKTPLS